MKYLVTGAEGFAGHYLTKELEAGGHTVVPLTRAKADLLDRDAAEGFITKSNPDGIFHLAAPVTSVGQSWRDPGGTVWANLASTLTVLDAARTLDPSPKVLFISSSEVLGTVPAAKQPIKETQLVHPESPYALSKAEGESASRFYTEQLDVPTLVARPVNHLGPGQGEHFVIPEFVRQIVEAEKPGRGEIKVGNLAAKRDFLDVRDVVKGYVTIMQKGVPGETYHVSSGQARSIRSVLDGLLKLSPATIKVVVDKTRFRPTDIPKIACDSSKLQKLGWQPKFDFTQTLTDILEAARKHNS